jgi:hypothetical protein
VNDVFVLDAWAKASGPRDTVTFLADGNGDSQNRSGLRWTRRQRRRRPSGKPHPHLSRQPSRAHQVQAHRNLVPRRGAGRAEGTLTDFGRAKEKGPVRSAIRAINEPICSAPSALSAELAQVSSRPTPTPKS